MNGNKNILAQMRTVYLPILDACNDRVRLDISECFSYADGLARSGKISASGPQFDSRPD